MNKHSQCEQIRWQDQRQQLLQQSAKQDKTLHRLDNAQVVAEGALETGHAALGQLEDQGKQLERARDGVRRGGSTMGAVRI